MTVPANLTARHYAEQAVLAAIITEREAMSAFKAAPTGRDMPELRAWRTAHDAVNDAADVYYAAVQAVNRTADPAVKYYEGSRGETYEVHDCPGGAYVITETPNLSAELQAALDRKIDHQIITGREPHDPDDQYATQYAARLSESAAIGPARFDPDMPDVDPADRYDSGYIAHPHEADGRAADEFYGRDN